MPDTSPTSDKRTALLEAALEMFSEHGVDGVAVPEISRRAGVATGTIYRYFPSKEALVNELYREQKTALGRRLNQGFDRKAAPKAVFDEFWRRLVAFAREQPLAYRFLELQDHRPYLDRASLKLERQVLKPMTASVQKLQEKGVFRSDVRHEVLMAMMWGAFVNLFKAERDGYLKLSQKDIAAARDACWGMFTGGA